MAVTITPSPTYPVQGRPAKIAVAVTGGGNYVRIWCTDAPLGSDLRAVLDDNAITRTEVFKGDAGTDWLFVPDKGGVYVLTAQEYTRGASTTGGTYVDSPGNAPSETKIGSETALTLQIGQRLTHQLGLGADTATLVLHVFDDTIRNTTLADHGEKTPAVIEGSTPRAKSAALATAVVTATEQLASTSATGILGTLSSVVADLVDNYEDHRVSASWHNPADTDTDNEISEGYRLPNSPKGLVDSVQQCARMIDRHMRNNDGNGDDTAAYHLVSTVKYIDWANLLPDIGVGEVGKALAVLGALTSAYESHRVSTTVHHTADTTNSLAARPKLVTLHEKFFEAIKANSPSAPATINSGAQVLISTAGFQED